MQTRTVSLIEKTIETFLGFLISLVVAPFIFALCDIETSTTQNISAVLCFTVLAIVRGYVIRRIFNKMEEFKQ